MAKGSYIDKTPILIPSCAAWFDAADADTIIAPSNQVSSWLDKSGNAKNATQAISFNQPLTNQTTLNGKNLLSFNGTSQFLTTPAIDFAANALTMIAVAKGVSGGSYRRIATGIVDQNYFFGSLGSNYATFFGNGLLWNNITVNTPTTEVHTTHKILSVIQNGNNNSYVNNTALDVKTSDAMAANNIAMRVGTNDILNQFWSGTIGELIVYKRALSLTELQTLTRYLSNKWGIAIS